MSLRALAYTTINLSTIELDIRRAQVRLAAEKAQAVQDLPAIESIEEFIADARSAANDTRRLLGMTCNWCSDHISDVPNVEGPALCKTCNDTYEAIEDTRAQA